MTTVVLALVLTGLAMLGLSVGVLVGRDCPRSCGGAAEGADVTCGTCPRRRRLDSAEPLVHDDFSATRRRKWTP